MNKSIDVADLESLVANHTANPELPTMTKTIAIDLLELDRFITQAKNTPRCDGIKIYFIRHKLNENQDHIKKAIVANETDKNLSQISLAFVPADITDPVTWVANDIKEPGDKIFTLLVCEPTASANSQRDSKDKTGMCPPKCKT